MNFKKNRIITTIKMLHALWKQLMDSLHLNWITGCLWSFGNMKR